MLLTIGPTGVYLIMATVLLLVLGGGTYLAYRMNRGQPSDRTGAARARGGGGRGEGGGGAQP